MVHETLDSAQTLQLRLIFENLELEKQSWYWTLGLLVIGMVLVVICDLLYNFPAASLTRYSNGTNDLVQSLPWIVVEYVIWFGLIGAILSFIL